QYKNALKHDPKYAQAHYRLALTFMKEPNIAAAVASFRRAYELLPKDSPDRWDSIVKLSEIYLQVARGEEVYMNEVKKFTQELLQRDPNSYDGHRLVGDWNYAR